MKSALTLAFSTQQTGAAVRRQCSLPLTPGKIHIITDTTGSLPSAWEVALTNGSTAPGAYVPATITRDGNRLPASSIYSVGLDDALPEISVREFLSEIDPDVDTLAASYDLTNALTLSCAFLQPTNARQLLLLGALGSDKDIIVLNDPFLPFNGRWRESFAEQLVAATVDRNLTVLCTNVSFVPKSWSSCPTVKVSDISTLASPQTEAKIVAAQPQVKRETTELNEKYYTPRILTAIPESAVFAYKASKNWLIDPLSQASTFLRTWSGIVVTCCVAFLMVTMGIVMFPQLTHSRQVLAQLSAKFGWKWTQQSEAPAEQQSGDQTAAENSPQSECSEVEAAPQASLLAIDQDYVEASQPHTNTAEMNYSIAQLHTQVLSATLQLRCNPSEVCQLISKRSASGEQT